MWNLKKQKHTAEHRQVCDCGVLIWMWNLNVRLSVEQSLEGETAASTLFHSEQTDTQNAIVLIREIFEILKSKLAERHLKRSFWSSAQTEKRENLD